MATPDDHNLLLRRLASCAAALVLAITAAGVIHVALDVKRAVSPASQEESASEVASHAIGLFLQRDWNALEKMLGPGSRFVEPASDVRVVGPASVLAAMRAWHDGYPGLKGSILGMSASGDKVMVDMSWQARRAGESLSLFSTLVFVIGEDGRIVEILHSLDPDELKR